MRMRCMNIWALMMEHFLEYIDKKFWKVFILETPRKEFQRERMGFMIWMHAKRSGEVIRTRFGGNANSKKMQKAVLKQQFKAFKISRTDLLHGRSGTNWMICSIEEMDIILADSNALLLDMKNLNASIVTHTGDVGLSIGVNILQLKRQTMHLWHFSSSNEQLSLNEKLTFQANEIYEKDEKLKRYRRIGMKAVKEKEQLQKTLDTWKDSSKNLWRLINSGMSSNSKVGLGFEIQSNNEVLSYEEEMNFSVFKCSKEDSVGKPLYSRFTKTNDFKGVPHPLSGDYTPSPQEEIDESFAGSIGTSSEHSVDLESEISRVPSEVYVPTPITINKIDYDYMKKKKAREAEVKRVVNIGNRMAKPVWTNENRVNHSNKFVPRSTQLNTGRPNTNSVRPNINTGRTNINSVRPRVNVVSANVNMLESSSQLPTKNFKYSFSPNKTTE
ncbi:hypothetical protein Tco_0896822 [Tanacetum coccineum]